MDALGPLAAFPPTVLYILIVWSLFWKGIALWRAARQNQRNWFIILFVVNTFGILDIIFLFFFSKKRFELSELRFWETSGKK